jgi:hypothetical protein
VDANIVSTDPGAALDPADLADAILARDASNVEATAGEHTLAYVILSLTEFDTTTTPNTLTVYRTDGTTVFATKTLTTAAAADAEVVTGIN